MFAAANSTHHKRKEEGISSLFSSLFRRVVCREGRANPGLMFSSSYIAGLAIGRLGRNLGHLARGTSSPSSSDEGDNVSFGSEGVSDPMKH